MYPLQFFRLQTIFKRQFHTFRKSFGQLHNGKTPSIFDQIGGGTEEILQRCRQFMAGRSRYPANLTAVAVGRISGDQIETFRTIKRFQLPQIGQLGTDTFLQPVSRNAAAHQLYYMRITVNAYYLSRTACCQQQADGPCTGAKFQNTGLPDQMRESCQKNSIRRKTKFFRVLPDRIITAGQGIAAFCSFTHFRSDRPWKHQRSRPILPG